MEDHFEPAGWALGLSGVAVLAGAWLAYVTGDVVGGVRTHMDATLVLGVLGLVLVGDGLALLHHGQQTIRRRGREAEAARLAAEEDERRRARETLRAQQQAQQRVERHDTDH